MLKQAGLGTAALGLTLLPLAAASGAVSGAQKIKKNKAMLAANRDKLYPQLVPSRRF